VYSLRLPGQYRHQLGQLGRVSFDAARPPDSLSDVLAAVRGVRREQDGVLPSIGPVDELLDERREVERKLTGSRPEADGLLPGFTIFVRKAALPE
jgi:hypothetical protein